MDILNTEGNNIKGRLFPCLCHIADQDKCYFPQDKDCVISQLTTQELPADQLSTIETAIDISIACLWPLVKEFFITEHFNGRFDAAWQMLCAAKFAVEENLTAEHLAKELAKQLVFWEQEICQSITLPIPYAAEDK